MESIKGYNELNEEEKYDFATREYQYYHYLRTHRIWTNADEREQIILWADFWEAQAVQYMPLDIFSEIGIT